MSARDRLQHYDAWIDPVTHQCQQTIYMATLQRPAGREGRHLQDPGADRPQGRGRPRAPRALQARELRGHAELRALNRPRPRQCTALLHLLPHLVNGLALGLLFALIALGFMLIVGVMETINLAHGSLFALGMYVALFFVAPQLGWFPACRPGYLALPIGHALRDRAVRWRRWSSGCSACCSSCACAAPTGATRCTACC